MIFPTDSTLALLGGAGKAGRPLVEECLRAGYRVRVLLRHPDQFPLTHGKLTVLTGDARNTEALHSLLQGSDALLSTLGHPKGEPTPIMAAVTASLLDLLPRYGIRRYLTVTSLYATEEEQHDPATRQAADFMQQHFPHLMADRAREFQLLKASSLEWTYIRLPYLVQQPATGNVRVHLQHLPGNQLTTEDLARFMLVQLNSCDLIRQAPFVANG